MIEWDRVAELRDEVGVEDFGGVVQLFLDEVEAALERVRAAAPSERLESDLHFIKGSAMNLGFSELAARCLEGERRARAGEFDAIDLPLIEETYRFSRGVFLDGLDADAPVQLVG